MFVLDLVVMPMWWHLKFIFWPQTGQRHAFAWFFIKGINNMSGKFWSGHESPKTATYGQYSDVDNAYAGDTHDKYVEKEKKFPPSLNNHHFKEK